MGQSYSKTYNSCSGVEIEALIPKANDFPVELKLDAISFTVTDRDNPDSPVGGTLFFDPKDHEVLCSSPFCLQLWGDDEYGHRLRLQIKDATLICQANLGQHNFSELHTFLAKQIVHWHNPLLIEE